MNGTLFLSHSKKANYVIKGDGAPGNTEVEAKKLI